MKRLKDWIKSLFTANYIDWMGEGVISDETGILIRELGCYTGKAKIDNNNYAVILIPFREEKSVDTFIAVLNTYLKPIEREQEL